MCFLVSYDSIELNLFVDAPMPVRFVIQHFLQARRDGFRPEMNLFDGEKTFRSGIAMHTRNMGHTEMWRAVR